MASHIILERGGAVVCIEEPLVFVGKTEEKFVFACAPSLWRFSGASGASSR